MQIIKGKMFLTDGRHIDAYFKDGHWYGLWRYIPESEIQSYNISFSLYNDIFLIFAEEETSYVMHDKSNNCVSILPYSKDIAPDILIKIAIKDITEGKFYV